MTLTRDEIMALTPEQLRVEIAKAKYHISTAVNITIINFYFDIPNYPTDIAAAWELVEEMKSGYFKLRFDAFSDGSIAWECATDKGFMFANTATLAISRAWLIWDNERKAEG